MSSSVGFTVQSLTKVQWKIFGFSVGFSVTKNGAQFASIVV
jgi:hypothetical protein